MHKLPEVNHTTTDSTILKIVHFNTHFILPILVTKSNCTSTQISSDKNEKNNV